MPGSLLATTKHPRVGLLELAYFSRLLSKPISPNAPLAAQTADPLLDYNLLVQREKPRVLAVIPARSGSKGLPGKNIRPLLGKPLIQWSIEQSCEATVVSTVHVSTDSQEIAALARSKGADVPYLRPPHLATDTATTSSVLEYALDFYRWHGESFDYVVLVEPTSPLRRSSDINNVVQRLHDGREIFDSILTLAPVTDHPSTAKCVNEDGLVEPFCPQRSSNARRQDLAPAFFPFVIAHAVKVPVFLEEKSVYTQRSGGYMVERWQAYEIDDELDFRCVEAVMRYAIDNRLVEVRTE